MIHEHVTVAAKNVGRWIELALAAAMLIAVAVFAMRSAIVVASMDWAQAETFYDATYRAILVVIGVELIRTLLTHDLEAILELLAFVVARKLLKPDVEALDILVCVAAFVALLATRRYVLAPMRAVARSAPNPG